MSSNGNEQGFERFERFITVDELEKVRFHFHAMCSYTGF